MLKFYNGLFLTNQPVKVNNTKKQSRLLRRAAGILCSIILLQVNTLNAFGMNMPLSSVNNTGYSIVHSNNNNALAAPPEITSNGGGSTCTIFMDENNSYITTVTATDIDAGTTLTYSKSGGIDGALFTIDPNSGKLSFKSSPNYEAPADWDEDNNYIVIVSVSDGSNYDQQEISVVATNINDNPPIIISNGGGATASINIEENNTTVTTIQATDEDAGTTLTYSITGGIDQGLLSIDGATGTLSFDTPPDFENPADANEDNAYKVTISVTDGLYHSSQAMTINITDDHVLPITLISFTVKVKNKTAILKWSTATEQNNQEFIISRSIDGQAFTNIGSIPGAGQLSTKKTYVFIDKTPTNGINFYRLQQMDQNSKMTNLGIRKVEFYKTGAIKLHPNPVRNKVIIEFPTERYQQLELISNSGKLLKKVLINPSDQQITISVKNISSGIYYIRLKGEAHTEVRKMLKL